MSALLADECWIRTGSCVSQAVVPSEGTEFVLIRREALEPWMNSLGKMLDYLKAGVKVVVILDPKTKSASVFRPQDRQDMLEADQTLTIPDVLPGFAVVVGTFFE